MSDHAYAWMGHGLTQRGWAVGTKCQQASWSPMGELQVDHNAPALQISAKWNNPQLSYWFWVIDTFQVSRRILTQNCPTAYGHTSFTKLTATDFGWRRLHVPSDQLFLHLCSSAVQKVHSSVDSTRTPLPLVAQSGDVVSEASLNRCNKAVVDKI